MSSRAAPQTMPTPCGSVPRPSSGVARAGRLGHGILLSGALPLPLVRALTTAHETAWIDGGRRGGRKPRAAALRNLWITTDDAERAAVLDWQRASYVLYQGLGWAVAESDAGSAMNFASDAAAAIETAVATTIIGSAAEVIDGLHEVAEAGVDDVVLANRRRRRAPGSDPQGDA